jgi:hypothetical protein
VPARNNVSPANEYGEVLTTASPYDADEVAFYSLTLKCLARFNVLSPEGGFLSPFYHIIPHTSTSPDRAWFSHESGAVAWYWRLDGCDWPGFTVLVLGRTSLPLYHGGREQLGAWRK